MFDVVIRYGLIIDGSGAPGVVTDVGVAGGCIAAVGDLAGAPTARAIDATGMVVAPGFVDMHTHSDTPLLADPRGWSKLRQGVTTDVIGNCGMTPYPVSSDPERARLLRESLAHAGAAGHEWTDLAGYRTWMHRRGVGINVAPLVGHSAIRGAALGFDDRPADSQELAQMRRLVAEAMEQGAFGLSTGLTLPPSAYGDTDEVVALCETMAAFPGRIYSSHVRGRTRDGLSGQEEALVIARRAGVPVQLSHMAVNDPRRWGEAGAVMEQIEAVAAEQDVRCDVYPYAASSSGFSQCLPQWAQSGGRLATVARLRDPRTRAEIRREMLATGLLGSWPWMWDRLMICGLAAETLKQFEGMHFVQAGATLGMEPIDAALHLMAADEGCMEIVFFYRTEEDMRTFLRHPLVMVGSDGSALTAEGPTGTGKPHPRSYGAHARVLGRYVRDVPVLTLEEAIRKMSGQVTDRLGMRDRGYLRQGMAADVVVFDPQTVLDRAEFQQPHQYPAGIPYVLVNGAIAVDHGQPTETLAGRVLAAR